MADHRGAVAGVLLALSFAVAVASCGGGSTPSPAAAGSQPATPGAPGGSPAGGGSPGEKVAVDETLLRFLPVQVAGFTVTFAAEATQEVLGDAALVRNATAVAYGLAVDPATGELVVAAVVKLKPGVFTDDFFRGWRTSYDQAACAQAGGVAGHAEAQLGGRTVYIGTCNGGARTYHAWLSGPGVVVSATSVGARRFGEQLIGSLRP